MEIIAADEVTLAVAKEKLQATFTQLVSNWGEPERAPHRRVVCKLCLYVCMCMSVCVHTSYHRYSPLQITKSLRHW